MGCAYMLLSSHFLHLFSFISRALSAPTHPQDSHPSVLQSSSCWIRFVRLALGSPLAPLQSLSVTAALGQRCLACRWQWGCSGAVHRACHPPASCSSLHLTQALNPALCNWVFSALAPKKKKKKLASVKSSLYSTLGATDNNFPTVHWK